MHNVVLLFSHNSLSRRWKKLSPILAEEGIQLFVYGQNDTIPETVLGEADIIYSDIVQSAPHYSVLLQFAQTQREQLFPGSMDLAAEFSHQYAKEVEIFKKFCLCATVNDLRFAVLLLLKTTKCLQIDIPAPEKPVLCGIACPEKEALFENASEYLFGNIPDNIVPVLYSRRYWTGDDLDAIKELMQAVRLGGFTPLPIYCDFSLSHKINCPDHPIQKILLPIKESISMILNMAVASVSGKEKPDAVFHTIGVPVLQIIRNYTQTESEWHKEGDSLLAMTYNFSVSQPEITGVIEPQLFACNSESKEHIPAGQTSIAKIIPDQVKKLIQRMQSWRYLQTASNSNKRIAIMLNNAPCKGVENTLSMAAGLDAAQSTVDILKRLKKEGYTVEDIPENGEALLQLIREKKAHSEFRWTHVEHTVNQGGALALIDETAYNAHFKSLPETQQEAINEAWDPFPAKSMVYQDKSGKDSLVIAGLSFGNISVFIEPKRGCYGSKCNGEVCRILHEPAIPPTHHWLATYWYIQDHFDALINMGSESSLDFLPGKRAALSQQCYPEISTGNLPRFYPYIMNSIGEALLAKRRGRGTIVSHLSAPLKLGSDNKIWDEIEELHRQWEHAFSGDETGRGEELLKLLRHKLEGVKLIPERLNSEAFDNELHLLPRRIQKLRERRLEWGKHILGTPPSAEAQRLYIDEAAHKAEIDEETFVENLLRSTDEMDNLIEGLHGRFIRSGQAGAISSGRDNLLPTGRNVYALDLKCIPTPAAWEVGVKMGTSMLQKYHSEEGIFPESIGITLWSSDVFMAEGELTSQILWLLGCRPVWNPQGKVSYIEIIPLEDLVLEIESGKAIQRPRVDVTVRMSGVVRDLLETVYMLLDDAVLLVSDLEEPAKINFVRKHVLERIKELEETLKEVPSHLRHRLATGRLFTDSNAAYGNGINLAIDASAWKDDKDLANAYINWSSGLCGRGMSAATRAAGSEAVMQSFEKQISLVDISYQRATSAAYDALSLACYTGYSGGMAAIKRATGGKEIKLYWGDSHGKSPEVRDFSEELDLALTVRLSDPEWIKNKMEEGYQGAADLSVLTNTLFAWSATTHLVKKHHFDQLYEKLVADETVNKWFHATNPHALEEITRRLMEAHGRKLWSPDEETLSGLATASLDLEGDIEDKLGAFNGEIQGSSVDVMTDQDVDRWQWKHVVK